MIVVRPQVRDLVTEIVELRRDLHRFPELGFEEKRTSQRVLDYLVGLGLQPQAGIAKTGVMALIEGSHPGPTLLLRADMDALPIQEETELPYASEIPGKMHACGHDHHTAILLGAARILHDLRERWHGRIKLVFQPAEEGPGGAWPMIEEGVLKNPEVDYALGLHLWSELPYGQLGIQAGPVMAAADTFRVVIRGQGGHAAYPHGTRDPIVAAATLITAMQTIVSRGVDPFQTAVLSVTQIQAGSADNIIPERVDFSGTLRTFDTELRAQLVARLKEMVHWHCQAMGVAGEFSFQEGYPALVNDASAVARVERAARQQGFEIVPQSTMGGEDMAYYLREVPGAFFFLGAAAAQPERVFPHHHPKFELNEEAIPVGIELFVKCAEEFLGAAQ